jgi:hypothetical protein
MDIEKQLQDNWNKIDDKIKKKNKWTLKEYVDVLAQKYDGLSDDQFDLTDSEKKNLKEIYDKHMAVLKSIIGKP